MDVLQHWGEIGGLFFLLIGLVFGMFVTGLPIVLVALLIGAGFAKYMRRMGLLRIPAWMLPLGFLIGLVIGSLNLLLVLPYVAGLYGGYKVHDHITTLDY